MPTTAAKAETVHPAVAFTPALVGRWEAAAFEVGVLELADVMRDALEAEEARAEDEGVAELEAEVVEVIMVELTGIEEEGRTEEIEDGTAELLVPASAAIPSPIPTPSCFGEVLEAALRYQSSPYSSGMGLQKMRVSLGFRWEDDSAHMTFQPAPLIVP